MLINSRILINFNFYYKAPEQEGKIGTFFMATSAKFDVYQEITNRVITALENNIVPWRKTWSDTGIPANLVSKKAYKGINVFLLNITTGLLGFSSNFYLTYKQAIELGGNVKKGEKGTHIIYVGKVAKEEQGNDLNSNYRSFLKSYTVFNVDQCDNIVIPKNVGVQKRDFITKHERAEEIVKNMPNAPKLNHHNSAAFYTPIIDEVFMPYQNNFETDFNYYATLFHELAHSTGHGSRLNRKGVTEVSHTKIKQYSEEELIAEMTATFLASEAGFETEFDNSIAYIKSWLSKLNDDKSILIKAASQAQKASDYILNL